MKMTLYALLTKKMSLWSTISCSNSRMTVKHHAFHMNVVM